MLRHEADARISQLEASNHQYAEEIQGLQESSRSQVEELQRENRKVDWTTQHYHVGALISMPPTLLRNTPPTVPWFACSCMKAS